MADINKVFAEAQKLNWNIESLLRLSSFETYGDLSGLHIDYEDGEQLFLIEELREIMEKLSTVNHRLKYLSRPVKEQAAYIRTAAADTKPPTGTTTQADRGSKLWCRKDGRK